MNCRIGEYKQAAHFGHEPLRDRKLLDEAARELDRVRGKVEQRGYTLVPLQLYFKDGWAKVELGLAKGRTHEDRRDAIAERETKREMDRGARAAGADARRGAVPPGRWIGPGTRSLYRVPRRLSLGRRSPWSAWLC